MMKYLNSWRKDPLPLFADIGKLEARLLFVALWHRDMHLILFDEDVGISAITPPDYFVSSQFTRGHFDMVTHALTSVASNIPVEGEPVPRYQPTLAANMTESVPAGDANDSISTAPTQPRPRPRQKPHPRAVSNSITIYRYKPCSHLNMNFAGHIKFTSTYSTPDHAYHYAASYTHSSYCPRCNTSPSKAA